MRDDVQSMWTAKFGCVPDALLVSAEGELDRVKQESGELKALREREKQEEEARQAEVEELRQALRERDDQAKIDQQNMQCTRNLLEEALQMRLEQRLKLRVLNLWRRAAETRRARSRLTRASYWWLLFVGMSYHAAIKRARRLEGGVFFQIAKVERQRRMLDSLAAQVDAATAMAAEVAARSTGTRGQ